MVGEFPELQGIMGRYYALHDGETAAVADAIAEHYTPQGPATGARPCRSVAVALADKIDSLVGIFGHRREADRLARIPSRCAVPRWADPHGGREPAARGAAAAVRPRAAAGTMSKHLAQLKALLDEALAA